VQFHVFAISTAFPIWIDGSFQPIEVVRCAHCLSQCRSVSQAPWRFYCVRLKFQGLLTYFPAFTNINGFNYCSSTIVPTALASF
jgi:energy-coupling factor transporter transmembrane protein EcfT